MIHYLIHVDTEGDIKQIRIAKGYNPADREIDSTVGLYCIHYMEALSDVGGWHETHAWNFDTSEWVTRDKRPNPRAYWEGGQWKWNPHKLLEDIKHARVYRLAYTDWAVLPDSPLTDSQKEEAKTYRASLRDFPANINIADINSVDNAPWPTCPSFLSIPKNTP